jgi:hypothetical protein
MAKNYIQNILPSHATEVDCGGRQEPDQDPSAYCKILVSKHVLSFIDLISQLRFSTSRREHAQ